MKFSTDFQNKIIVDVAATPQLSYFVPDINEALTKLRDNSVVYLDKKSSAGTQIFLSIYAEFGCRLNHDAGKHLTHFLLKNADFVITSVDKSILKMLKKNIKKNAINRGSELGKLNLCIKEFEKDARAYDGRDDDRNAVAANIENHDGYKFDWER